MPPTRNNHATKEEGDFASKSLRTILTSATRVHSSCSNGTCAYECHVFLRFRGVLIPGKTRKWEEASEEEEEEEDSSN
eukprot:4240998-Amphidinium_carterae.2